MPIDFGKILRGAGDFAATMEDPQWKAKRAIQEAELAREQAQTRHIGAQTGLVGAQTEQTGAETARTRETTETEGLRQTQLQAEIDQLAADKKALEAAASAGQIPSPNLAAAKAILDSREADLRKRIGEANIRQSDASAAYSRAGAARLNDPTRIALETQALVDLHKTRAAQRRATEALAGNREAGPARVPGQVAQDLATAYAEANVNRGRAGGIKRFFGGEGEPLLEQDSPEYMREIARLKQEYYAANPETAGGWSASGGPGGAPPNLSSTATTGAWEATNLADGIYKDQATGQLFMVQGGKKAPLRDQPMTNPVGLGGESAGTEGWEP